LHTLRDQISDYGAGSPVQPLIFPYADAQLDLGAIDSFVDALGGIDFAFDFGGADGGGDGGDGGS
jgi:hypothetical protein